MKYRKEKDTMGTVLVPETAYYGPQTQRAIDNFPIGTLKLPASFNRALALVKKCAARVNQKLGLLDSKLADAIAAAAQGVIDGQFDDQFVVNVFQTGSGTSANMNMNEVLACRANECLPGQ
jgi:fumarate hydratase class II